MSRPTPATSLKEFAEKTGINEFCLKKYAFLSDQSSFIIKYQDFEYPCFFAYPTRRYATPKHYFRKEINNRRIKFVPKVYKYFEGTTIPDTQEDFFNTIDPNVLNEYYIIPLDENVDRIIVNYYDYHDCNSNNPREWYIFRSWEEIDKEHTSWVPDTDKWNRFSNLSSADRARILWLWSQYLNLSSIGVTTSRGPKTQHLRKIRILLIISELEERETQYKHFWTANFLNIIYRLPYMQGNVDSIRGYNPDLYDLDTKIKTKSGDKREERAGEVRIKSTWSAINKQIKPLEKIHPSKLSLRHVR